MNITIPDLSLVVLIGATSSGKSTFAARNFKPTEVLSSDFCRALVADDEGDLAATTDAFDVLHYIAAKRLRAGHLTVVDATNVQPEARKPLIALARQYHCLPVAIVLNLPERLLEDRNRSRPERNLPPHVIRNHTRQLRKSLGSLQKEGFRHVFVLRSPEEIEGAVITREPLYNDKRNVHGPFDIIGDVHGCADELEELLHDLGYRVSDEMGGEGPWSGPLYRHPDGRIAVFLGDLVDRGPRVVDTLRIVHAMVAVGDAYCIPGNHDMKLLKKLQRRNVQITHGLESTLAQIDALPLEQRAPFERDLGEFLDGLVSHYVFDDGKLVVAHAGMREEMQGRGSGAVRNFALYGETTGETDEFGLPVRYNWAAEYRGKAAVVYGHTPVAEPEWVNNTVNIDTGCVFGGRLTALRYPERELVSVPARHTYYESAKPFLAADDTAQPLSAQQSVDDLLDIEDVLGKRIIETRLQRAVTVREENAIPALEVMSRFAANPHWLIYLPPTMSPTETTAREGLLEHPAEAFRYYRSQGVPAVICEEKHMGSRAVVIVCRDEEVALRRFGVVGETGICYTRTGRRFFEDSSLETALLDRVREAVVTAHLWEELDTDWLCLDCELLPWSVKAGDLLQHQYAAVGAAGRNGLAEAVAVLQETENRATMLDGLLPEFVGRREMMDRYVDAYRRYCWPVTGVGDLKLGVFHVLASESGTHTDRDHRWHMAVSDRLAGAGSTCIIPTRHCEVDLTDRESEETATRWWEAMTEAGGEGMVVKPIQYIVRGGKGLVQPGIKCRGREYLRIIYGPEYTAEDNLKRLRSRHLGHKRALALREFALGIESLERFVRREPLRRVHECVFGVLALESEPVDPRL